MISVIVNGKQRSIPGALTVLEYLEFLKVNPLAVAVELRGEVLSRDRFGSSRIDDGDNIEIVRMMGGG